MARYTTPFGYLLHLLDITCPQLARILGIDRSVVNKWALGIRPFQIKSKHYKTVIDYFLMVNESNGTHQLEEFLDSRYSTLNCEGDRLTEGLHLFLSGVLVKEEAGVSLALHASGANPNKNEKTLMVPTAMNEYGRYLMFSQLLEEALHSQEPVRVMFYDYEQFLWIMDNPQYFDRFKKSLILLLKGGHHLTIISDLNCLERYADFSVRMSFLDSSSNFVEYTYIYQKDLPLEISYYAILGKKIIYGKRLKRNQIYTIGLEDPLSLQSFETLMRCHLAKCTRHLVINSKEEKRQLFQNICEILDEKEQGMIYSPGLSFSTMSEPHLIEVLEENGVGVKEQNDIRYFHRKLREQMVSGQLKQLCHYQQVLQMSGMEKVTLTEISQYLGRTIVMSHSRVRDHIWDTIALLEENPNYQLGFFRHPAENGDENISFICKENQFFLLCHQVFKCVRETELIQGSMEILKKEWNGIPEDYKNREMLAKKLRQMTESTNE